MFQNLKEQLEKNILKKNPNAVVKYHFTGKTSKEHPTSGYQKFFGIPYGGVMVSGVSNALSKPNYRMQNTLGGFDIIYTKDNAKVQDDWGYHSGAGNWESIGGIIKKVGETFGTKRNGEEPIIIKTDASFPYLEDKKFAKRTFTE